MTHNLLFHLMDEAIPHRYRQTGGGWDWIEVPHPDEPQLMFWIGWADPAKRAHWFDDGDRTPAECIDLARAELLNDADCDVFSLGFQPFNCGQVAEGWVAFVGIQYIPDPTGDHDEDAAESITSNWFTAVLDADGWDPIIRKAFVDGPMLARI